MTHDIHPRWKSTSREAPQPSPREEGTQSPVPAASPVHHVFISKSLPSSRSLIVGVGMGCFVLIAFAFMQGVFRLQANLTEETEPDVVIAIGDIHISPEEVTVNVGDVIEWGNATFTSDQLRSDEQGERGPLIETPVMPIGTSHYYQVPFELGGKSFTVRSVFVPSRMMTLHVEYRGENTPVPVRQIPLDSEKSEPPIAAVPQPSTVPAGASSFSSIPSTPIPLHPPVAPPVQQPVISETLPNIPAPVPSVPRNTTLTINVGESIENNVSTSWPSFLKINRFTVGSPFVPAVSPVSQIPVHVIRDMEQQVHSVASPPAVIPYPVPQRSEQLAHQAPRREPPARRQPETGPALPVLAFLSFIGGVVLFRRRSDRCAG